MLADNISPSWPLISPRKSYRLRFVPLAAIGPNQIVGCLRPPRSGSVRLQWNPRVGLPLIENPLHEFPRALNEACTEEQRMVTRHHVEQQPFVGVRRVVAEL